jgi:hypothetical protein
MVNAICVLVGLLWALSVWGAVPRDKNGRTDR